MRGPALSWKAFGLWYWLAKSYEQLWCRKRSWGYKHGIHTSRSTGISRFPQHVANSGVIWIYSLLILVLELHMCHLFWNTHWKAQEVPLTSCEWVLRYVIDWKYTFILVGSNCYWLVSTTGYVPIIISVVCHQIQQLSERLTCINPVLRFAETISHWMSISRYFLQSNTELADHHDHRLWLGLYPHPL